jgi:hypothetical protein
MDPNCFRSAYANDVATVNCIPSLINAAFNCFLAFSGMVALFLIAWGAIRMITSGGDSKQIDNARRTITFSIVGLIVVLMSFAIVNLIGYTTRSSDCITNISAILSGCP